MLALIVDLGEGAVAVLAWLPASLTSLISITIFLLSISGFVASENYFGVVIDFGVGTTIKPLSGLFLFTIKFLDEIVRIGILPTKSFSCNFGVFFFSLRTCLVSILDFLTNF